MSASRNASVPTHLVTGVTGNIGKHVAAAINASGAAVARGVSRHAPRDDRAADTCVVDLQRSFDASALFDGVSGVFLNSSTTAAATGVFLDAAADHGVEHVVLVSSCYVDDSHPSDEQRDAIGSMHRGMEELVEQSGIAWTYLRADEFASNARWQTFGQITRGDIVYGAYPHAKSPVIHPRDIGEVAARVLLDGLGQHAGRAYHLTGPESLSEEQRVLMTGSVIGRRLSFVEVTPSKAVESMTSAHVPEEIAQAAILELRSRMEHPVTPTAVVTNFLQRDPLGFDDWLREHREEIPA